MRQGKRWANPEAFKAAVREDWNKILGAGIPVAMCTYGYVPREVLVRAKAAEPFPFPEMEPLSGPKWRAREQGRMFGMVLKEGRPKWKAILIRRTES